MELNGKRVAVLAERLFEDLELWVPVMRLREAGAQVEIIGGPGATEYQGKHGVPVTVDRSAEEAHAEDYDGLVIPGGYAPDRMRRHEAMLALIRGIHDRGGVVAMICHAGWAAISAGIVDGKRVTSTPAIKDDLINAGATWSDEEVVEDGRLISSRSPEDLPAFNRALIAALAGGAPGAG
jgi:protease I